MASLLREATAAAASTATKRDKHRVEEKDSHKTSPKKTKLEEPVEATFKLVCTSLEELRELISKIEDELDELESTKKRAAQQASWFQKRESVKELHITLIRLLNELSPWEPKLIKAFHRNRLRLKRDFDNFKKHPEYDNFVREECVSSSEDEEDMSAGSFTGSDPGRLTEEEDPLEHSVPRGLWTGDASRQLMTESAGDSLLIRRDLSPSPLKRLSSSTDEDLSPPKRLYTASGNTTATSESLQQHRYKTDRPDSNQPPSAGSTQVRSRPVILHPTIGLPKGYTPIPTLLAKSVGNKVTLMKRPADHPSLKQTHGQARVVSMPTATLAKPPQAPSPLSPGATPVPRQQIPTPQQQPPKQSLPVCRHLASATITTTTTACSPSSQQTAAPKTPVQLVYKMAEGLGHLLRKDSMGSSSSPMKISVQPVVDPKTGEKTFQQVVLLPHNLLVPEKTPALPQHQHHQPLHQQQQLLLHQQPKTIQAPAPKIPTAFSTSVSGFTIPDSKIPIQQVAPLKDVRTVRTASPAALPRLQGPGAAASPGFKVVPLPSSPRASTPLSKTPSPSRSPISSPPASTASSDVGKSSEIRQELKTVCIRDSQSILVTTRGGNTGVVKVQTSTDQNSPGSLPTSPVISICPQFKAFLVSKSSLCPSAPLPPQSVSSSVSAAAAAAAAASSVAQPLPQPATIPTASPASQAAGSPVPFSLNHGYNIATVAKTGQASPTIVGSTPVSVSPRSTVPVPAARSVPHANVLQCINKPALKQVPDERSLLTKFILVSPPSSSSNAMPKAVASSPDSALAGSRVMFVNQLPPAFSKTLAGSAPTQPAASAADGQSTRLPAEALSKLQSLTLPSGVQIRLPGRSTNTLGQTVCSLPQSPSVSTAGSGPRPGQAAATSSGLVFVRNPSMVTTTTTTTCSSPAGAGKTFSPPPPTAVTQPSLIRSPPAPVCATHHGLLKASPSSPVSAPQSHHSLGRAATTLAQASAAPPTPVSKIPHAQPSSPMKPPGASLNAAHPVTSASTGTVQQRIVINTSAPLAAGTQIVLNGTRFVVPPQGLGPGSHVLIISSPAPPPTTSNTTTITAAGAPPRGPGLATPPSPTIPWVSPVRSPGTPALRPAGLTAGPPGVVSAPRGSPLPAGGSSLLSALSTVRLPGVSAPLVSPALGPPRLAGPVSPILTRTPALGTIVPSTKLPLTPCLAPHLLCSSSIAPGPPAPAMLRLPVSTPVQCSPVVPSTPVAALPTPAIPSLAPLPPPLAQPSYVLSSPPPALGPIQLSQPGPGTATPRPPGTQLHKAALRLSALSVQQDTVTSTGLTNAAATAQAAPAVQTASPRSAQVLPIAVPSMGSRVFRMQSLPVATVPPSHIIKTSAQPFGKVTTSETISQPVLFSTAAQAAAKTPLQSSAQLIHTNLASSKPLVSPDGAVLNTVQGLVHPASLPVISTKHLATLVVTPSSTAGRALPITVPSATTHTDSPHLQSAQPDSSEPINPASS